MTGGSFIPVWLGVRMRRRAGQDLWPLPSPYPLSLIFPVGVRSPSPIEEMEGMQACLESSGGTRAGLSLCLSEEEI